MAASADGRRFRLCSLFSLSFLFGFLFAFAFAPILGIFVHCKFCCVILIFERRRKRSRQGRRWRRGVVSGLDYCQCCPHAGMRDLDGRTRAPTAIYCSYFMFATFLPATSLLPPLPPLALLLLLFISLPALASFPFSLLQMKMKFLIKTIRVVFIAATAAAVAAAMCNIYYIGKDICPTTCQFQFIYKCTTYIYIEHVVYIMQCAAL